MNELVGMQIISLDTKGAPKIYIDPNTYPLFSRLYTIAPPTSASCCDLFYAADESGHGAVLGSLGAKGSAYENTTSMAISDKGTWKSVWTETAALPAGVFRDLARSAGVHIYADTDDPLYVNQSFVTLVADQAGSKTITFPRTVTVRDAMTEVVLQSGTRSYQFSAGRGEAKILRIE